MLIKDADLIAFLHKCVNEELGGISEIVLPGKSDNGRNGDTFFTGLSQNKEIDLDSYRTVDPTKTLFYLARERMVPELFNHKKRILLGVKACDLAALEILDKAMLGEDFYDPSYEHWRKNTFIVSSDCEIISKSCACTMVGGKPFAESGFDLNLSRIKDSYLIETGSDKGEGLLKLMSEFASLSKENQQDHDRVKKRRLEIESKVSQQNNFVLAKDTEIGSVAPEFWETRAKECVGCGGCTNICPTCYCLILNDESESKDFIKVRSYDSCQWNGYARVAGGGTPRPKMDQRFRNRYLCKFQFMNKNFGRVGCTGCGRCTDTCPAQIEFQEVLKSTEKEVAVH